MEFLKVITLDGSRESGTRLQIINVRTGFIIKYKLKALSLGCRENK
jgi:hypothetical protein